MKAKYAGLIAQLELVTKSYEAALAAVKALETTTAEQPDVLGVKGGVVYFGDSFEEKRAIHIDADVFTLVALDCGSDIRHEALEGKEYARFCCTVFGYRVFCLAVKESALALLLARADSEGKPNE